MSTDYPDTWALDKMAQILSCIHWNVQCSFQDFCKSWRTCLPRITLGGSLFFSALHLLFSCLIVLSLRCFVLAFSSCGEWDLVFALVLGLLIEVAPLVAEHRLWAHGLQQLWHVGLVAPQHVKFSQTRDRTPVPCIGRWILIQCATREVHCASYDACLSLSGIEDSFFLIPPATKSCFIYQNLHRRWWNERAGVMLPHHSSQITIYTPVWNTLVFKRIFDHTVTGYVSLAQTLHIGSWPLPRHFILCPGLSPDTSYWFLACPRLAGFPVSFVSASFPDLLSEFQTLLALLLGNHQSSHCPTPPTPKLIPRPTFAYPTPTKLLDWAKGPPILFFNRMHPP